MDFSGIQLSDFVISVCLMILGVKTTLLKTKCIKLNKDIETYIKYSQNKKWNEFDGVEFELPSFF